ncbi:MAG TPA: ATP-dependent DNA helicase, partial [Frankiaceae bacterium]|nr:ATP-dependent DNA helicase [Frankiaceae bacterium]
AFAGRLVAEHGLRLGVEPHARLLTDATRFQLAGRVLRRHRGPVEALDRPLSMLAGDLVALESELSEHVVDPAELAAFDAAWLAEVEAAIAAEGAKANNRTHVEELRRLAVTARQRRELAVFAAEYRAVKAELEALDFGDQVTLAARLAKTKPEVGVVERERAGVVLLDEYQDTSVAQRRMLAGLFGGGHPVTAVGDPCQAIYGWRGASVANLDRFPEHFHRADGTPAPVYELSVSHRSGGKLLRLANRVAEALRLRHHVVELHPRPEVTDAGHTVVALHERWDDEVRWVARRLREVVDAETAPPGRCAVLVRARADVPALYAALGAEGLPVEVVGLGGLLSLPEVADVVATLEVLDDPTANAALVRLLTGPRVRLGVRDLAALGRQAREALPAGRDRRDLLGKGGVGAAGAGSGDGRGSPHGGEDPGHDDTALEEAVAGVDACDVVALADVLDQPGPELSEQARARVAALGSELRALRRHVDEPLPDLVHRIVTTTGLDVELAASPQAVAARRHESLAAFLDVVAGFVDVDGESSLSTFLAFLRAAEEHERGLDAATPSGADAVQLMTVHKAKGLEWDVVAVPDLTRGVFPIDVVRQRWTTNAAVLPTPLRGDAVDLPAWGGWAKDDVTTFKDAGNAFLEREERRLGYVAFTRARSLLLASGHWWGPTQRQPRGPSPFLDELYDHARAGHGEVELWTGRPADERNPHLAPSGEPVWPSPYEPQAYLRRRAAADQVLADLDRLRAGEPPPPDDPVGLRPDERALLDTLDRDAALLLEEAARERWPVREVLLPRSLTTSQLVRLRTDPAGLARELARPLPRRPVPQARRGTRFHAWVEELSARRPLLDPEDLPGAEDDGVGDDDLAALQEAFLAGRYGRLRPYAVEAPFDVVLAGRVVRGRIDVVYERDGGRWEVVDWKTGTEPADPVQLAVYRLAWARLRGVPPEMVDAAFLYVRTGEVEHPPLLGEAELSALLVDAVDPPLP